MSTHNRMDEDELDVLRDIRELLRDLVSDAERRERREPYDPNVCLVCGWDMRTEPTCLGGSAHPKESA